MNWWSEGVPEGEESIQHNYVSILSPTQSFRSSPLWSRLLYTQYWKKMLAHNTWKGAAVLQNDAAGLGSIPILLFQFRHWWFSDFAIPNRRFFSRVTVKFDRWPWLQNNIKLSASFHRHAWIQTGVTVRAFSTCAIQKTKTLGTVNARRWLLPGYWILYTPV